MTGSVGHDQFKTFTFKKKLYEPFLWLGFSFYFLALGLQDFLELNQSTSGGKMAGSTLEQPNCFQPRTPGLVVQHLSRQATACLDLLISFLCMSKHNFSNIQLEQQINFRHNPFFIHPASHMKCHSSFRTIKQNKSQLVSNNCDCLILLAQKNLAKQIFFQYYAFHGTSLEHV